MTVTNIAPVPCRSNKFLRANLRHKTHFQQILLKGKCASRISEKCYSTGEGVLIQIIQITLLQSALDYVGDFKMLKNLTKCVVKIK